MQAIQQNTQEWVNYRKDKIGASDIPIILGMSPYCTPYELWRRKLGFSQDPEENQAQKRGKELEQYVLNIVNENSEYIFSPKIVEHPSLNWAIASLDGIDEKNRVILEIKCTSKKHHEVIKNGSCPDLFYPQIQWQLFVTGYDFAVLSHYFDNEEVRTPVRREDGYIEQVLLPAATDFYMNIFSCTPPELIEKDHLEIVDQDFGKLASEWLLLKKEKEEIERKEKSIKQQLIEFTDDGNCQGFGIVLKRKIRQGSIDWDKVWEELCQKFTELNEFNIEKYRKPEVAFWEIRENI